MKKLILTCEHGGAKIPSRYQKLFRGKGKVLKTHQALDIGALPIAFNLKKILRVPLDFSVVSRLVVDLNRFLDSPTLFSEFTSPLSDQEKFKILQTYYAPHWKNVIRRARGLAAQKHQVIHVAVHSMTDRLHGRTRPMQLALLYDSKRKGEKHFANLWIEELRREFPGFKIARNNPYKGDGNGLTSFLRSQIQPKNYLGIELEMNQGFLKTLKTAKQSREFSQGLADSLQRALDRL